MENILTTDDFRFVLKNAVSQEPNHIWIASAYVKLGAFKWLIEKVNPGTKITLIGRFLPNDLITGSSDVNVIDYCLNKDITIGMHNRLHAKFYNFVGLKRSFLGSANLTNSGLGLGLKGNEEMTLAFQPKLIGNVIDDLTPQIKWIDHGMLNDMTEFISKKVRWEDGLERYWPFNPVPKISDRFFSSDFPDIRPVEIGEKTSVFLHVGLNDVAEKYFCSSIVHDWVVSEVENNDDGYTNFGWLASKIHGVLLDDPLPFRSGVKEICALLFEWIERFSDRLWVESFPRTKALRLKNNYSNP